MKLDFLRLCVLSDRARMGPDPAGAVTSLAQAGLRAFQWREKDLTPAENHRHLEAIVRSLDEVDLLRADPCTDAEARGDRFHLFVNDRADLALALCLDLHLAESSAPTAAVRGILHPGQLVGRSVHDLERARAAEAGGADYVTFGPVFDTPSKRRYGPPVGLPRLREVCAELTIPVLAIGGIHRDRVPQCLEAGAAGVAVIGAVWDSPDPAGAVRDLLGALGKPGAAGPGPAGVVTSSRTR